MGKKINTPGVYIEEKNSPATIVQVPTAIPGFIGFTERAPQPNRPTRINSLFAYQQLFGGPVEPGNMSIPPEDEAYLVTESKFKLYPSLQLFFANGGGACYILSIGNYKNPMKPMDSDSFTQGIDLLRVVEEVSLLAFPDAVNLDAMSLGQVQQHALLQCAQLKDRFCILDVLQEEGASLEANCAQFRNALGNRNLSYGAAYYPNLQTSFEYRFKFGDIAEKVSFERKSVSDESFRKALDDYHRLSEDLQKLRVHVETVKNSFLDQAGGWEQVSDQAKGSITALTTSMVDFELAVENNLTAQIPGYSNIIAGLNKSMNTVPPSGAVAGIYAAVDADRGVWKAPANIGVNGISGLTAAISNRDQEGMNVPPGGKSINAIREFPGKGLLLWGARTLDGNSPDGRYVNVRRLGIMVEEAVKKSCLQLVAEPNTEQTWGKVRGMIEEYLAGLWRKGAFAGAKPEEAFYVNIGLNKTMTPDDMTEGRMIVHLGYAPSRPAEFNSLRFTQQQQPARILKKLKGTEKRSSRKSH